ncbi:hypothetical protein ACTZWW_12215 [Salinarimonas sp. NSM]|uniref:hypothetical protein n=1 Tax=Salinarimonas sp. NSM TaxID=3458003 RepID=UPI004036E8C4
MDALPGVIGAQVVGWDRRARSAARRDDRPLRVADLYSPDVNPIENTFAKLEARL